MLTNSTASKLQLEFPHLTFQEDLILAPFTYFKIGGPAKLFVSVQKKTELEELVKYCRREHIEFVVFGGASNVLISDKGLQKLVIKNLTKEITITKQDGGAIVEAESGLSMNILVRKCINESLEGLEYFMGLPGTVGGAIYNNAHFVDQLIGNFVLDMEIIDIDGNTVVRKKDELQLAYDYSKLQETHETVLSVRFFLKNGDKKELEEKALIATKKRATTQPIGKPSSGCMFQNANKDGKVLFAGMLIDQAGLKGERVGDAVVSDVHANFIVNAGKATSKDVDMLAELVQKTVHEKFGVMLKREVFSLS